MTSSIADLNHVLGSPSEGSLAPTILIGIPEANCPGLEQSSSTISDDDEQQQQRNIPDINDPPAIEEIMGNLAVDPSQQPKHSNAVSSKDGSPSDATSCISSAGDATSSVRESDVDHDSLPTDQGLAYPAGGYYGYYYPGYDGSFQGPDDQVYYMAGDGTELQYPVVQADNGSLIYFMPGIHPAYNPYAAYLPVTMVGVDGQYASQPQFSASPVFQPSIASPGYMPTPLPYGEFIPSPYLWDPSMFAGDGTYGNGYTGMLEIPGSKPHMSSASHTRTAPSKKLPSDFSNSVDLKSSHLTSDTSGYGARNQSKAGAKPSQNVSAFHSDVMGKGYYPVPKFASYNQGKGSTLHTNSTVKSNVGAWSSNEKPKNRSKTNSISDIGLTNGQTYDPRTGTKGSLTFGVDAADSLVTDGKGNINSHTSVVRRDQYNLPDFPTKYDHALFFVIKSYSEDDIHKCIKYNVWASTPNGNKRLDTAYHDAQEKMASAGSICPVFLFFSVNASGQFCGVAEMTGPVDYGKSMDFWQQDKWNGFFPVKWHIIKDVPNPQLRHIILENNENKPVTNSRDTQEVRFPQGIDMLKIFKNYVSKTSILDDFDFYESRQKVMQEKRPRPLFPKLDPKQPKADELIVGFHSVETSAGKNMVESEVGEKATG